MSSRFPMYHCNLFFNAVTTTRTTTQTHHCVEKKGISIGLSTNKGIYIAIYLGRSCVILGKDGVSRCVHKMFSASSTAKALANFIAARFLGIFDTIQTVATAPVFFAIHTSLFVGGSLGTIFLLPTLLQPRKRQSTLEACTKLALNNFYSILSTVGCLVLTPIEIITPEINIKVLKMHKWGARLPESEG